MNAFYIYLCKGYRKQTKKIKTIKILGSLRKKTSIMTHFQDYKN